MFEYREPPPYKNYVSSLSRMHEQYPNVSSVHGGLPAWGLCCITFIHRSVWVASWQIWSWKIEPLLCGHGCRRYVYVNCCTNDRLNYMSTQQRICAYIYDMCQIQARSHTKTIRPALLVSIELYQWRRYTQCEWWSLIVGHDPTKLHACWFWLLNINQLPCSRHELHVDDFERDNWWHASRLDNPHTMLPVRSISCWFDQNRTSECETAILSALRLLVRQDCPYSPPTRDIAQAHTIGLYCNDQAVSMLYINIVLIFEACTTTLMPSVLDRNRGDPFQWIRTCMLLTEEGIPTSYTYNNNGWGTLPSHRRFPCNSIQRAGAASNRSKHIYLYA